jgi:hypothetical protein
MICLQRWGLVFGWSVYHTSHTGPWLLTVREFEAGLENNLPNRRRRIAEDRKSPAKVCLQ